MYRICNGIFNHTSLYQYHQGKLLIHLTVPFEEKPKNKLPGDYLRYYRLRKSLTTRQLAELLGIVPATIIQYEKNLHSISHDIAIPYTEELRRIRSELKLNQREFADMIGITPSYYYKIEAGVRRPSRRMYRQIMECIKSANQQTSQSNNEPLQ
ncbi:helix-turn-helix transcriptional regulator [Clostridioides difficile]|nr:helix-turn-helix transcriptional regulator [Clostridioides difficile]MDV9234546.1 helix-turn-helix transcriptional regulator [Clostridioides difficile]